MQAVFLPLSGRPTALAQSCKSSKSSWQQFPAQALHTLPRARASYEAVFLKEAGDVEEDAGNGGAGDADKAA